jgi:hypothetical protein
MRITLSAPTASANAYKLASLTAPVSQKLEARLSITQHCILIDECNEHNIATRQCQLLCRRDILERRCGMCRSVALNSQLLGMRIGGDNMNAPACTLSSYKQCGNVSEYELQQCVHACKPACSNHAYELTTTTRSSGVNGTTLVIPSSDYIQFTQSEAYTWFEVVADCGGLM